MFRPIPNHDSPIRTHRGDYVGVLRLVSCFVHLAFMVDFLNNVEFDLHLLIFLRGTPAISANLFSILVIVRSIRSDGLGQLHGRYL